MQDQLHQSVQPRLQRAGEWLKRLMDEWRNCRECGGRVAPLAQICRHCGARNPIKISAVQSVVLSAALAETLLLLLHFA